MLVPSVESSYGDGACAHGRELVQVSGRNLLTRSEADSQCHAVPKTQDVPIAMRFQKASLGHTIKVPYKLEARIVESMCSLLYAGVLVPPNVVLYEKALRKQGIYPKTLDGCLAFSYDII